MEVQSKYMQNKSGQGKLCHVYIHCYPDGTPYYVGIGRGRRCYNFGSRSLLHQRVTNKIIREGGEPIVKIDRTCSIEDAIKREIRLIAHFGRRDLGTGILVNHSPGGQFVPEKGRVRTSDVLKGNLNRLGTTHSDETKRLISEASKRNWRREDYRKTQSEKSKTRWETDEEYRRKVSEGVKRSGAGNYERTEETRKKISENYKGRPNSPELIAGRKAYWEKKYGPGHVTRAERRRQKLNQLSEN